MPFSSILAQGDTTQRVCLARSIKCRDQDGSLTAFSCSSSYFSSWKHW